MDPGDITRLLEDIHGGDPEALDKLFNLIYEELRVLARHKIRGQAPQNTLDSVALVNEAYLKLVGTPNIVSKSKGQFFALASSAMRSILVDRARYRMRDRRGGGEKPIPLENATVLYKDDNPEELLDLDDALTRLQEINEEAARVVECRFFGGLTLREVSEALDIPFIRVRRRWESARAWLFNQLRPPEAS